MVNYNDLSDSMMNLDRNDVLELLSIASGPSSRDLEGLLSFFTARNPVVRFASLWRINRCNDSISIVARSSVDNAESVSANLEIGDYRPQLQSDGTGEQEFICDSSCASIAHILQSVEFISSDRKDCSILQLDHYDQFHPRKVVEKHHLDHFVALPISVKHQPDNNFPRFMCLLYCQPGRTAKDVRKQDLKLIHKCVGNLIYNVFSNTRQATTAGLTKFLTLHHSQDEQPLLDYLIEHCIVCEAVFVISRQEGPTKPLVIKGSKFNDLIITQEFASRLWDLSDVGSPLKIKQKDIPKNTGIRSTLIFQPGTNEDNEKSIFVFCNKKSRSPLCEDGVPTFINDFGFDDVELMGDVGSHLKAFTETVAEENRRNDLLRIVAHETKQPALDMWNAISSHRKYPQSKMFNVERTLDIVEENAELSFALAEMNMDFGGSKIQLQTSPNCASINIARLMRRFKNALNSFCDDSDFNPQNIVIDIEKSCKELRIQKSVIAAFFINMVTNAIKYSHRGPDKGWCSIKVQWAHGHQDPIWRQIDYHKVSIRRGLLITVTDNGRGISEESKSRVFDRNFREVENDGVRGLGLGLFRVAEIVKAYEGEIWVTSSAPHPNHDLHTTRFGLILPRTKVAI